jgi:hypothetical protein
MKGVDDENILKDLVSILTMIGNIEIFNVLFFLV